MSIIGPIVHCTYCVPLCSFIGPIVTIVIPLHNHITVGPHTKCAESVLSMAHVSRFCNKEIGPKNYSKVCNHSTLGVTPASPSETVFANKACTEQQNSRVYRPEWAVFAPVAGAWTVPAGH